MDKTLDVSDVEKAAVDQPAADPRYGRSGMALNAAIVMTTTIVSSLLGLLRDAVIASQFGTGEAVAAYQAAFRIPDLIYSLVIGGALGSAFIPVFSAYLAKKDDEGAWRMASSVLNLALLIAMGLAGIIFLLAPWIVSGLLVPKFTPEQQALTTRLSRLLLLQPILLGVGGLAMAVLNTFRRFLLTSLAPLIYNLSIIAGAAFLAPRMGIDGLVAGVLIGAALYVPVLLPGLLISGMRYRLVADWRNPGVREVGRLLLPRMVGQAAVSINFFAIVSLASFSGPLAVAAISFANNLFRLPLSLFGMSIGTVSFPTFAALGNEGRIDELRAALLRIIRIVLFLTLPISALMLVLRFPAIQLLYERNEFTATSTSAVSAALLFFLLGLAAACVTEVVVRTFYALHDTRTPVILGTIIVALNVALGFGLLQLMGFTGVVLGFSLTNTIETIALLQLLRRKIGRIGGTALLQSGVRSLAAAALSAGAVALLLPPAARLLPGSGLVVQAVRLGVLAALGAALYLGIAALLRSPEIGEAWALFRRRG